MMSRLVIRVALTEDTEDHPWRHLVQRDRHEDGREGVVNDCAGHPVPMGRWSGHSLRSEFATGADHRCETLPSIMKQTGHTDPKVAAIYLRETELFRDNVTAAIFRP